MCLSTSWCTCSCRFIHNNHCLRGYVSEGWWIISRQPRERKTGLNLQPLNSINNWRLKRSRLFKTQGLKGYQPEAVRVHRLESNNQEKNWGQTISLGIWNNYMLYYTTQYMAWYDHIWSYSMLCVLNNKAVFSKCYMIQLFFQREMSWCIYLCWYRFYLTTQGFAKSRYLRGALSYLTRKVSVCL